MQGKVIIPNPHNYSTCIICVLSFPTRSELIPEAAEARPNTGEAIVSVGVPPPVTAEARLGGMASGARDPFVFPLA